MKKQFNLVNLVRVFCAYFVFFIHSHGNSDFQLSFNFCVAYQAVPFFFIVSGFFFAKKKYTSNMNKEYFINYIKNIFLVYCFWALIFLPVTIQKYFSLGHSKPISLLLVIFDVCFHGSLMYWYLFVLGFSIIILYFALKFNKEIVLYVLSVIFIALFIIYNYDFNHTLAINKLLRFFGNDTIIFKGIPYLTIGTLIAKSIYCKKFKYDKYRFYYIVLYVISLFLSLYLYKTTKFNPLIFVTSSLLFLISISFEGKFISDKWSLYFRNISSCFYMSFILFSYLSRHFIIPYFSGNMILIIKIITIFIPIVLWYIVEKKQIKFLKKILLMK